MRHAFQTEGGEHEVWLARDPAGGYRLHALDRVLAVGLELGADGRGSLRLGDREQPLVLMQQGDDLYLHLDGANHQLRLRYPRERASAASHTGADDEVRAPMPGTAISVAVKAGDAVARGAPMLVMESMKLETTIAAPRDATVRAVLVAPGQAFDRDTVLVSFEPPEAA